MKRSNVYIAFLLIAIIVYLLTYINKIGLHGDEAFFGLNGIDIMKNGISKPYGMNHYSGILQALLGSIYFKLWKIDVISLRIGGIIFNVISLILITKILKSGISNNAALIFLLLFAQSVFLLCHSKVAGEVNSFNFLLIAIPLFSIYKLKNEDQKGRSLYYFVFLLTTFLGSYNHIIFSSIVLTMVCSMVLYLCLNQVKPSAFFLECLSVAFISLCNIICLFLVMNKYIDEVWGRIGNIVFIIPIIVIILEALLIKNIFPIMEIISKILFKISFFIRFIKMGIISVPILFFIKIHFLKFFDVLGNEVPLLRYFSYTPFEFLKWFHLIAASAIIVLVVYYIISDLIKVNTNIWTYFIVLYLGVLCIYTEGYSIRYFHILTILLFLYLSINLAIKKKKIQIMLVAVIAVNAILVHYTLWNLNINDNRKVKAMAFHIGNKKNNVENSAHFLNFLPVIDYVKKNKVGKIHTKDTFFIGKVFEFYKHVYPEIDTFNNSVTVNYEWEVKGSGFLIE